MRKFLHATLLLSLAIGACPPALAWHLGWHKHTEKHSTHLLTKADAAQIVETLPELQQLARIVQSGDGGKSELAINNESAELEKIGQSPYWSFDIYVKTPSDVERWGTIMVRTDGQEVLVSDFAYHEGEEAPYPIWHQWRQLHGMY